MDNKGKNIQKKDVKKPVSAKNTQQGSRNKQPFFIRYSSFFIMSFIWLLTFICYHYSLYNSFINWDDGIYVYENPFIKSFSSQNLSLLFKDMSTGNYHPLTMLSLALNWHFSGANPEGYYATEIGLHLLNTLLVFLLVSVMLNAMVKRGYGKIAGIPYLAGLCALWHGIHPMHVESVSWISERKDLLYVFFYLFGLIAYVRYIAKSEELKAKNEKAASVGSYLLVLIFFCLSLISKPMAIVFPFALFAFDILLKRKMELRLFLEKIPLFIISFIFAYITYRFQSTIGAVSSFHTFTFFQRITFAGYNYLMYMVKLFFPFHLSSFYPYPELAGGGNLPMYFYGAPLAALLFTGGILYLAYKKGENYFRVALFGFTFYFFNVMLILQFISAGQTIMADRYTYASYFGLTFMLAYFIYVFMADKPKPVTTGSIAVLTLFSCMLAWVCQARTHVWHNSGTLWADVVSKSPIWIDTVSNTGNKQYIAHVPQGIETAYKNLGHYYIEKDSVRPADYDSAYKSFAVLERVNFKDVELYSYLGNIWALRGDFNKALAEYTHALRIDSTGHTCFDVFLNRGITYYRMGQYVLAVKDFNRADKIEPNNREIYETRATMYLNGLKQMDSAIADYSRLIAMNPDKADYYMNRGLAEFNKNDFKDAITDFAKNMSLDAKNSNTAFNLSLCYKDINDIPQAIVYANKAKNMGYKLPDGYLEGLQSPSKKHI